MHVLGFHHLAIQVRQLESTARFYRELLGLPEMARHVRDDGTLRSIWLALPEGAFLALEEVRGGAAVEERPADRPGFHVVALRIDRADRGPVLAALAAAGVRIERQTRWTVFFRDHEGNRVALSHHPADAVAS